MYHAMVAGLLTENSFAKKKGNAVMCVFALVTDENCQPSHDDLRLMHEENEDGAGIAWEEENRIRFVKGLRDHNAVIQVMQDEKVKPPYIVHFRITSVGDTIPQLTHPFPITKWAELSLIGETDQVLFHNGTWGSWDTVLEKYILDGIRIPSGPWSDTRAMAWLIHKLGVASVQFLLRRNTSRVVAFSAQHGIEILNGAFESHKGYRVSNTHFVSKPPTIQVAANTTLVGPAKFVNIDGWKTIDPAKKPQIAEALRRSPKYGACTSAHCLHDLYADTGYSPQYGDRCNQCNSDGGAQCKKKAPATSTVTPVIPITIVCKMPGCNADIPVGQELCSDCLEWFHNIRNNNGGIV